MAIQSTYRDGQIYEIDIDKIYQDYVQSIDSKRSYVNVISLNTSQLFDAIGGDAEAPSTNNLFPAKTFQESRCHAFFRIIGFPVVNDDMTRMYNPGHDIIFGQRSIKISDKIAIAEAPIKDFNALSNFREQYFLNNLKIFSTPETVDAGVLALSCGINSEAKRLFQSPYLINSDPFDMDFTNQSYSADYSSRVGGGSIGDGGYGLVDLTEYQDSLGNKPQATTLPGNRFHVIKPFIVDPRIDFCCSPTTNRIGVPFVPNNSFLRVSSTTYADPPLLEIIIRDRFNQLQETGQTTQEFAQFIKSVATAPPNQSILGQIVQNDIQQLSTNAQFLQFLNIIQAMVKKLVEAQNNIATAQSQYYWLPIPSLNGPEGGCTVPKIFLPNKIAPQLVTSFDGNIIIATAQSLFSQTQQNAQAAAAQGIPDVGGFARQLHQSLGPSSSSAYVNNSMVTLDSLGNRRQTILAKASDSLRIIEIIMGEFSGLGLCDMIAILASLYTMPANNLLGFLDVDAQQRMNSQFNQQFNFPNFSDAMRSFSTTVGQFYQLMDAIYQNETVNQGLSS